MATQATSRNNGSCVLDGRSECTIHWQHFDEYTSVGIVGLLTFSVIGRFELVVSRVMQGAYGRILIDLSSTEAECRGRG